MLGTFLNAVGILVGGVIGLIRRKPLSPATESYFKVTLAAITVFYGLRLVWLSINGSFLQVLKQLFIVIVSLMVGKVFGGLMHLQRVSNRLGQYARQEIQIAKPNPNQGFKVCAALFCAAPLGLLGALQEGLSPAAGFYPLGVKAATDGLATMSFVRLFGWGAMMSALPVLAVQGTITILAGLSEPFLAAQGLIAPINGVAGLLIFSVALVMLGLKRIELTDYLPSLFFAPFFSWLLK